MKTLLYCCLKESNLNLNQENYYIVKEFPINVRLEHIKSMARILEVNLPQLPTKQFAPLSWKNINEMKKNDYSLIT